MKILLLITLIVSSLWAQCMIKDQSWSNTETKCKNGFLDGFATAYHNNGKLKFEGTFKKGTMVHGTVFYKNNPFYIGNIVDNEMHGEGICYFKEKPEKCEYYKGDRVDALYKLRFLMRQQIVALQALSKEHQELKEQSFSHGQNIDQGSSTNSDIGGKVVEKVTEKAIDMILDEFF